MKNTKTETNPWIIQDIKWKAKKLQIEKEQEKQIYSILFSVGVMRKDVTINGCWLHFQYYGMQVNFSNRAHEASISIHRPPLNKEEEKILNNPPIMSLGYQSLESDEGEKFRKDFLYEASFFNGDEPVLYLEEILRLVKEKAFEMEKLRQRSCL